MLYLQDLSDCLVIIFSYIFHYSQGEMEVTPACYAHLVNSLSHLASGKIAVFLEVRMKLNFFIMSKEYALLRITN